MARSLIEIDDGLFIQPWKVVAVKRSALDEEEACTVFLSGQSAQDGFIVERDADEVVGEINDALGAEEGNEEGNEE
jgi:hypothetical protein